MTTNEKLPDVLPEMLPPIVLPMWGDWSQETFNAVKIQLKAREDCYSQALAVIRQKDERIKELEKQKDDWIYQAKVELEAKQRVMERAEGAEQERDKAEGQIDWLAEELISRDKDDIRGDESVSGTAIRRLDALKKQVEELQKYDLRKLIPEGKICNNPVCPFAVSDFEDGEHCYSGYCTYLKQLLEDDMCEVLKHKDCPKQEEH